MRTYFRPKPKRVGGESTYTLVETHQRWVTLLHRPSGLLYLISPDGQKQGTAQTLEALHLLRVQRRRQWAEKHQQL